jgi:hypothetical protein
MEGLLEGVWHSFPKLYSRGKHMRLMNVHLKISIKFADELIANSLWVLDYRSEFVYCPLEKTPDLNFL